MLDLHLPAEHSYSNTIVDLTIPLGGQSSCLNIIISLSNKYTQTTIIVTS